MIDCRAVNYLLNCAYFYSTLQRCLGGVETSGIDSDSDDYPIRMIGLYTESGGSLVISGGLTGRLINNPEFDTTVACAVTYALTYQPSGTIYPIIV